MGSNKTVFAFDLGTGSIGECVRQGNLVKHLASFTLPEDFASTKDVASRRRMIRTRIAHKSREQWWKDQAKAANIEVLSSEQPSEQNPQAQPDQRLLKEFPAKNENIIYTSSLLRIALIQGEKLEGWQVYKAIRSAIQHRGYDKDLPWLSEHKRNNNEEQPENSNEQKIKDELSNKKATSEYEKRLKEYFNNATYHLPCYYEAYRLGLWSPNEPNNLSARMTHQPKIGPARNLQGKDQAIPSRQLVEKELSILLEKAAILFPKLKGKENYVIYGPGEKQYASYYPGEYKKHHGKDWDWQGLISQKIPRFDNRIISKCVLIPRLNVCRADDSLNKEVTFLFKLKNMRYFDNNYQKCALNYTQIKELFETYQESYGITATKWKSWLKENNLGTPIPGQTCVEKPRISGRSRFCRPALRILKQVILSGESPEKLRYNLTESCNNENPQKGLIKKDYDFLYAMGTDWQNIYIPDQREEDANLSAEEKHQRMYKLINKISNPVVRHRLLLLIERLKTLEEKHGKPDQIVFEVIREDFMGEKAKRDYEKNMRENEKKKDAAVKELQAAGIKGKQTLQKQLLLKEQGGKDPYDGAFLDISTLDDYQLEHIVPREQGGPDAMYNKVVTKAILNQEKGNRTPYQWLSQDPERWTKYLNTIKEMKTISNKKRLLLTSPDAKDQVQKYTALAATAYIEKLTQRITSLYFNWNWQTSDSERKILVVNGAVTAKVRRQRKLDAILHSPEDFKKYREEGIVAKKNRDNQRHHALDALVLSTVPEIKYDPKTETDTIPEWLTAENCKILLDKVIPTPLRFRKPILAETIYGLREIIKDKEKYYVAITRFGTGTSTEEFSTLAGAKKYTASIFDPKIRKDFTLELEKNPTEEQWHNFIRTYTNGGKPQKISLIASGLMTEKDKNIQTRTISDYMEVRPKSGQYIVDKRDHQGQIVYKDISGIWQLEPIFVFESAFKKTKSIPNSYIFKTNQTVEIKNNCKIPKGIYRLSTINNQRKVYLYSIDNTTTKINLTLKEAMEKGEMRPYLKE